MRSNIKNNIIDFKYNFLNVIAFYQVGKFLITF